MYSPLSPIFLTVRIDVNIKTPEANREALVFPLTDIKGVDSKKHFCDYYIMLPMDIRYILGDTEVEFYKARVFSSNSVLVTLPSWPYGPLMDRDEAAANVDDCVTNAMDNARHAYSANKAKGQWKHLYLVFPDDHELSAKEMYTDAGEDSELDIEIVPIRTDMQAEKNTDLQHWAAWKIARVDISPVKRGKIDSTTKTLSKAAALAKKLYSAGMKEE
jgi:hypothetical protein